MTDLLLYDHTGSICSQMARLALVEKGLGFRRQEIDILETSEQFEPWYVALNPKAVVPTLRIGADEVVTDTIRIVGRVDGMAGPDLSGGPDCDDWLRDIMGLHYGVLLYAPTRAADGTHPRIEARGRFLDELWAARPDLRPMLEARLAGNARFRAILKDEGAIADHVEAARGLVSRMAGVLEAAEFLSGGRYSLADCFATAALARFRKHGYAGWWADTPVADYYARMRARPSFAAAEVDEG